MTVFKKSFKILTIASIALIVLTAVLAVVLNFTYVGPSVADSGILKEYARFAKYIANSLVGQANLPYPTDLFANLSFFFGLFMGLIGVAWAVLAIIKKEFVKVLYLLESVAVGFVGSFAFFLLISGLTYNHVWDFKNELSGGNLALYVLILIFAALASIIVIGMFVLYIIHFIRDQKEVCTCEEKCACECKDECECEKECECEECTEEETKEEHLEEVSEEPVKEEAETVSEEDEVKEDSSENGEADTKKKRNYKAYHISKHPTLDKWQVKATGSNKALKLFDTQEQAIQYAKQVAKNQGVSIRVHSKKGRIRSI